MSFTAWAHSHARSILFLLGALALAGAGRKFFPAGRAFSAGQFFRASALRSMRVIGQPSRWRLR